MAVKIMDNRRQTMITDGDLLTPLLGGMNFREIGEMLRCIHNAKWRSDKRFDGFDLGFRCDDEVIWDYWTVGRKAGKEVAIWELTVRYSTFSSSRELFISHDYSRTLRVGRSTAYKARPASPPAEYDFWIDAGWIEGDRERAYKEIYDINQFSIRTVEAEKSAEKWLDSGFDPENTRPGRGS